MSYIGNEPSQTLASPTSQYFNGTGSQTVFTLNRLVNVSEDLEVFVNNIQQEPGVGKSYTATGTTLTFDAAPSAGTANVYVIYRGLAEVTTRLETDPNSAISATTGTFSGAISATTGTFTGDLTVDTNTLYVDSTNNRVGIGTTSPPDHLSVVTTGANAQLSVDRSDGGAGRTVLIHSSTGGQLQTTGSVPLIFGTADIERMRIDSSGRVTMPNQPAFGAYRSTTGSGNRTYVSGTYYRKINYTAEPNNSSFNVGNSFNATTGIFTAPVGGIYVFHMRFSQGIANGRKIYQFQFPNGAFTEIAEDYLQHGDEHAAILVKMNANDSVSAGLHSGIQDNVTLFFSGYLLG
jgi:hypothetical protein